MGAGDVVGEIGSGQARPAQGVREASEAASGFFLTNSQVEMLRRETPDFEQKLQSLVEARGF